MKGFILSSLTRKELAQKYGIHVNTLRSWLKNIGFDLTRKRLTPKELEYIYSVLGEPEKTN